MSAFSASQNVLLDTRLFPTGTVIPKNCVEPLKEALSYDAVSVSEQAFEQTDALK